MRLTHGVRGTKVGVPHEFVAHECRARSLTAR